MALEAFIKGIVSRVQPQASVDTSADILRLARYGEAYVLPLLRKQHVLADEGSYFVANNQGTGVATSATPTSYSDLAPFLTIFNSDSPSNTDAKRIHLDWLRIFETAAGTAGVDFRVQIWLDTGDKYSSGGTTLSATNPNQDVAKQNSVAIVRQLPTALALGAGSKRCVVGDLQIIGKQSAVIPVDTAALVNFGGVEGTYNGFPNVLSTSVTGNFTSPAPPIVIGPGGYCIIDFKITSQSAASSWAAEIGWWER